MILKDKVSIVAGGARIGKAIAMKLAHGGASVVVDYHGHTEPATALVNQIENLGCKALAGADVSNPETAT